MKEQQEIPSVGKHLLFIDKIPNTMKLTWLFLSASVFGFTAQASAQRMSVALDNAKVEHVLEEITEQTGLGVAYSDQIVDLNRRVSIHLSDAEVNVVLDKLTEGTTLGYDIRNGKVYLYAKSNKQNPGIQQSNTITGVVVDANGEPIIGANVVVKGTTNGTITDIDGRFSLEAPGNAVLSISYIGFNSKDVAVNGQTSLQVKLLEDTQKLDEVVVVGYGTQKKVNLTGSVSSVKFDEEMANRPITDASQALSGKVSGVWISQNSGKPGDDGAQLRIRGWGTLNNSDPLVIIDGVEGVFSQINPSDIESITVLKDAASAAIYGSKAANGVVLVTTKMGKNNEKTQVELNSYVGFQQLGRHYDLVTNSAEHMTMANQAMVNNGGNPLFPESMISDFASGTDPYKYPNTDWYDYIYRNALITGHNLSIRGGSEKLSSFMSLNYLKQDGIIMNSDAERYGIRTNIEYKVNNWLRIGSRLNYTRRTSQEPFHLFRVFEQQTGAAPFISPYTRDGKFGSVEAIRDDGTLMYTLYQPLIDASNGATKTTSDYMSLNAFAIVDFSKDLNLQVTWASNGSWKETDKHNETIYGYTDSGIESLAKNYNRDGIVLSREQISTMRNSTRVYLIGDRRDVNEVVKHCDLYLNTYPLIGGLMSQYAAANSKPILTYGKEHKVEGVVNHFSNNVKTFFSIEELLAYARRCIDDENFRIEEGKKNKIGVMDEEKFNSIFCEIFNDKYVDYFHWDKMSIDYDVISNLYLDVENNYSNTAFKILFSSLKIRALFMFPQYTLYFFSTCIHEGLKFISKKFHVS